MGAMTVRLASFNERTDTGSNSMINPSKAKGVEGSGSPLLQRRPAIG
jgi:hypothetical protein